MQEGAPQGGFRHDRLVVVEADPLPAVTPSQSNSEIQPARSSGAEQEDGEQGERGQQVQVRDAARLARRPAHGQDAIR